MAYSVTGLANLSLGRIGAKLISNIAGTAVNEVRANAVWEYVRDEVLEAKDWRFAKIRAKLAQSATVPLYTYAYAYPLPADFMRFARGEGVEPIYPAGYPYIIEALPATLTKVLMTDYDNQPDITGYATVADYDLYINYISKVTDVTKYSAHFINTVAWRWAQELSLVITEASGKFEFCAKMYEITLVKAEGLNRALDYIEDDTEGSREWVDAGRE